MASASAPVLPQGGEITSFSYSDGVGRIRLDDGTELKVGTTALKGIVSFDAEERPLVGVRVLVDQIAPHPLGGFRAMALRRAQKELSFAELSTAAGWSKALESAGMKRDLARELTSSFRVGMRLVPARGRAPVGSSKLGGDPDVPAEFVWPTFQGEPLAFLGQLRLRDLAPSVRQALRHGADGLLAFFVPLDADLEDEGCTVALFAPRLELVRTPGDAPTIEEHVIAAREIIVPTPPEVADPFLGEDETATRIYGAAFADHVRALGSPAHWVGGHPFPLQGPVELEGERLLLQIDSDDELGLQWGDCGRLYFVSRPEEGLGRVRCEVQSG